MPKTILIADDSESIRMILRMTLQFKGFTILEAADGAQAFEILKGRECDLIIADIAMPNMTGLELLQKVRQELKKEGVPIIICTAEKSPGEAELLCRGATRVVEKPFSPIEFMEMVERLLP